MTATKLLLICATFAAIIPRSCASERALKLELEERNARVHRRLLIEQDTRASERALELEEGNAGVHRRLLTEEDTHSRQAPSSILQSKGDPSRAALLDEYSPIIRRLQGNTLPPNTEIKCVGSNSHQELGHGAAIERFYGSKRGENVSAMDPIEFPHGYDPIMIAGGLFFSCALVTSKTSEKKDEIICWGRNSHKQLGVDDQSVTHSPPSEKSYFVPIPFNDKEKPIKITAGSNHACVLTSLGRVFCWGWNRHCQLGRTTSSNHVAAASSRPIYFGSVMGNVVDLECYGSHCCALFTNDRMKCWGHNENKQASPQDSRNKIGCGNSPSVKEIDPIRDVIKLASGSSGKHTCAIFQGNEVKCWGNNTLGQTGQDASTRLMRMMPIASNQKYKVLAIGPEFTCGISTETVECWGALVGIGPTSHNPTTIPTPSGSTPISLSAGWNHVCITFNTNEVMCWGLNSHGELGMGRRRGVDPSQAKLKVISAIGASHLRFATCFAVPSQTKGKENQPI